MLSLTQTETEAAVMQMSPPISFAAERLFQAGILGALCVIFGVVIYLLWTEARAERQLFLKQIEDLQHARIDDVKTVNAQIIENTRQCTNALNVVTATLEGMRDVMTEYKNAFREQTAEIREQTAEIRELAGNLRQYKGGRDAE